MFRIYKLCRFHQSANEGGVNYGDEYLAELDYVEVVEGMKEGYESDVVEDESGFVDGISEADSMKFYNANVSDNFFTNGSSRKSLDDDSESIR